MPFVEQAIFTSAVTDHGSGYHLVATSPDLEPEDARELARWGPSHDSLLDAGPDAQSINFFPLPSGASCLSRTVSDGWEYSGRGRRIYTQCIVVSPEVLARFGNHPFALLRALSASGSLDVYEVVPRGLAPLPVAGRAAVVDQSQLARLALQPGAEWMASLMDAVLASGELFVTADSPLPQLISGLLSCLPLECRRAISFSTGLRYCPRRPIRILAAESDPSSRRLHQRRGARHFELHGQPPCTTALSGWPKLVEFVLASGRTTLLAAALAQQRAGLTLADLPALGAELLEQFRHEIGGGAPPQTTARGNSGRAGTDAVPVAAMAGPPEARCASQPCARIVEATPRATLEKLERLDDLVFEAIAGRGEAIDPLARAWSALRHELGVELLAESREQYLRHALTTWEAAAKQNDARDPSRAVRALDVLCILFEGE